MGKCLYGDNSCSQCVIISYERTTAVISVGLSVCEGTTSAKSLGLSVCEGTTAALSMCLILGEGIAVAHNVVSNVCAGTF